MSILNGWKEIGSYLKVHEQTAIEWGKTQGLPYCKIKSNIITTTGLIEAWIIKNRKNKRLSRKLQN